MYRAHATLQYHVADTLMQRLLPYVRCTHGPWWDVGCGTGAIATAWTTRGLAAAGRPLWQSDVAYGMCRQARLATAMHAVCVADFNALPIADATLLGLSSAFAWQWSPSPESSLIEAARVVRPGGYLAYAVPTQRTLHEVATAYRILGYTPPLHTLSDSAWWETHTRHAGFALQESWNIAYPFAYPSFRAILWQLKQMGARYKLGHYASGVSRPMTRGGLAALEALYSARYPFVPEAAHSLADTHGTPSVYATWEVYYAIAIRCSA
jgi:malonyl-CoA O-methyltransferase